MSKHFFASLITAAALVASLSACSGSSTNSATSAPATASDSTNAPATASDSASTQSTTSETKDSGPIKGSDLAGFNQETVQAITDKGWDVLEYLGGNGTDIYMYLVSAPGSKTCQNLKMIEYTPGVFTPSIGVVYFANPRPADLNAANTGGKITSC